ncbi:hypothetical protein SHIRM173S_12349 [Streptomyces hirsutus]
MRRRLFIGLTAASVLVTATACGSSGGGGASDANASSGGTTEVKVGLIPIVDVAPLYLGEKKGFFSERGLKLSISSAQGGAAIVPGVASGQFEFGFSNMTSLLIAQSNSVPVKGVANGNASTGVEGEDFAAITVKGDSPIKSAKTAELVIGAPGLGARIAVAQTSQAVPEMYALVVVTGLLGLLINIGARTASGTLWPGTSRYAGR